MTSQSHSLVKSDSNRNLKKDSKVNQSSGKRKRWLDIKYEAKSRVATVANNLEAVLVVFACSIFTALASSSAVSKRNYFVSNITPYCNELEQSSLLFSPDMGISGKLNEKVKRYLRQMMFPSGEILETKFGEAGAAFLETYKLWKIIENFRKNTNAFAI